MNAKTFSCKKCFQQFPNMSELHTHYGKDHGGFAPRQYSKKLIQPQSAFDRILDAEQTIKQAVRDLETERNILSEKLLNLDDKIAKYKKLV